MGEVHLPPCQFIQHKRAINHHAYTKLLVNKNNGEFNPALFARLAAGDGFALVHRCRALHREACYAGAQPIGNGESGRSEPRWNNTLNPLRSAMRHVAIRDFAARTIRQISEPPSKFRPGRLQG